MKLSELQDQIEQRWGSSEYSPQYNARPDAQRDAHHAALHITKALGKIAGELDDLDHEQPSDVAPAVLDVSAIENAIADIVICATRVASRWPGSKIDIGEVVRRRLEAKFPPQKTPEAQESNANSGDKHACRVRIACRVKIAAAIAMLSSEQQSKWDELQRGAQDPLDTLASWTPEQRAAVRYAVADYAGSQTDARDALSSITLWSPRLGIALTCAVARMSLRHVPQGETRPLCTIETVERWSRGDATEAECSAASATAFDAYTQQGVPSAAAAARAARYAADAVNNIFDAGMAAWGAADACASAGPWATVGDPFSWNWDSAFNQELQRLCTVIADALRTGSVGEWIG